MRENNQDRVLGRRVAGVLRGAWRAGIGPCNEVFDETLCDALSAGGVLGLVSQRLPRDAGPWPEKGRLSRIQNAASSHFQALALREVLPALRERGVDPILLKGLAAQRHYPFVGGRPVGDIDLLVSAPDLRDAGAVLGELGYRGPIRQKQRGGYETILAVGPRAIVDLQPHLWPLDAREVSCALRSEETMRLDDLLVRVPPREFEIRFLAVHAAKHAFFRPIWSCDLAAAVEASPDLSWDRVLSGSWHVRSWVLAALGVAVTLLDLQLPSIVERRARHAASWLEPQVLARWGGWSPTDNVKDLAQAVGRRDPGAMVTSVAAMWPDPLEAQTQLGWPLSARLATPARFALVGRRGLSLPRRLWYGSESARPTLL